MTVRTVCHVLESETYTNDFVPIFSDFWLLQKLFSKEKKKKRKKREEISGKEKAE